MGEAKRRKAVLSDFEESSFMEACAKVSSALRRLAEAASAHLGGDCFLHAALGQRLMADLGFAMDIQVGFAAWRVGPGDGDVVAHTNNTTSYLPAGVAGAAYHAWLTHGHYVVDFTAYQLPRKASELDALDGGRTLVRWAPEYLALRRDQLRTYKQVAMAPLEGVAYYEMNLGLQRKVMTGFTLDEDDLATARILLANQDLQAIGPNQV